MIEMFGETDRMSIQPGAELFECWFLKDSDDIFAWWVNRMLVFGHLALVGAYRRFMVQSAAFTQQITTVVSWWKYKTQARDPCHFQFD